MIHCKRDGQSLRIIGRRDHTTLVAQPVRLRNTQDHQTPEYLIYIDTTEKKMAKPKKTDSAPAAGAKPKANKQETLHKLAGMRVPKAIKAISLVGNLGAYKPTEAQSTAILAALVGAVNAVRARLTGSTPSQSWSLPE